MPEKTLAEEIITLIQDKSTNTPPPETATVLQTHTDNLITIKTTNGVILEYVSLIGTAKPDDTVILLYFNDQYTDYLAIGVNLTDKADKNHTHGWETISTSTTGEEQYVFSVNPSIRLAELIITSYKPTTDKSGSNKLNMSFSGYKPTGIGIRRTNKTGIDIGITRGGDVYTYGSISANTNVQGSIMWHYLTDD